MENYQTDGVYFPQADSLSFWVIPPQWGRKAPSSPQFWQGNEVKRPVRLVTPFNSSGWYRWAETHLAPTAYIPPNKYLQMANKPHALRKYIEGWRLWCYDPPHKRSEKVSIPYVWPLTGSRPLGICREPFQDKKEDVRLKQVLREMKKDWQRCFCRGTAIPQEREDWRGDHRRETTMGYSLTEKEWSCQRSSPACTKHGTHLILQTLKYCHIL